MNDLTIFKNNSKDLIENNINTYDADILIFYFCFQALKVHVEKEMLLFKDHEDALSNVEDDNEKIARGLESLIFDVFNNIELFTDNSLLAKNNISQYKSSYEKLRLYHWYVFEFKNEETQSFYDQNDKLKELVEIVGALWI